MLTYFLMRSQRGQQMEEARKSTQDRKNLELKFLVIYEYLWF